jgi:hypothetical protein
VKILHRARVVLQKEVDVPDELWKRHQELEPDQPGYDAAHDELSDLMSREGITYDLGQLEEVDDEWYLEVK